MVGLAVSITAINLAGVFGAVSPTSAGTAPTPMTPVQQRPDHRHDDDKDQPTGHSNPLFRRAAHRGQETRRDLSLRKGLTDATPLGFRAREPPTPLPPGWAVRGLLGSLSAVDVARVVTVGGSISNLAVHVPDDVLDHARPSHVASGAHGLLFGVVSALGIILALDFVSPRARDRRKSPDEPSVT